MFAITCCRRKPDTARRQFRSYGGEPGAIPPVLPPGCPTGRRPRWCWMDRMADADRSTEHERATAALPDASARLVRTVDGFHGDDWRAPSLLPGWTRAHVVAHLGLN